MIKVFTTNSEQSTVLELLDSDAILDSSFPKTLQPEGSGVKGKVMTTDTFYTAFPDSEF